jgi:GTP-binding protein Era
LVKQVDQPVILVVNKVDRLKKKAALLPQLKSWLEHHPFAAIVPTSATGGVGLDGLLHEIWERLPPGKLYPDDFLTDRSERFFAAELIREAILRHTRGDIPQGVAVQIDEFVDEAAITRIAATIVVDKASHKGIVIGAGGQLLKQIGTEARLNIEEFIQRKVFLKLWVKLMAGWTADPTRARELTEPGRR